MKREELVSEAIRRMRLLGLSDGTVSRFENGEITIFKPGFGSESITDDNTLTLIRDFEKEYDAKVYYAIYSETHFGKLISLLHVSGKSDPPWSDDPRGLDGDRHGIFSYVINLDHAPSSEFGTIGVRRMPGGMLERTW